MNRLEPFFISLVLTVVSAWLASELLVLVGLFFASVRTTNTHATFRVLLFCYKTTCIGSSKTAQSKGFCFVCKHF